MAHELDLSALNLKLGAYARKNSTEIFTKVFQTIEFENKMKSVSGVTDEYVSQNAQISEVLQAYQCEFTPKGAVSINAHINKVRQIKIDMKLNCVDELYRSWTSWLADENKKRTEWPITKWIMFNLIVPAIAEELNTMSWSGVYVAPTPGTAGPSIASVNGMGITISDAITAGDIVPIVTGAITPTNVVDVVEQFVRDMPSVYRKLPGKVCMSSELAEDYWYDHRAKFGQNMDYSGKPDLKMRIGSSKKIIEPVDAMFGSQRIFFTPDWNLIKMYDKVNMIKNFDVQLDKREICIMGDFKRGWGVRYWEPFFCNDQA